MAETSIPCLWCGEDLTRWDCLILEAYGYTSRIHIECLVRSVVGSVGHQMGWCHCPGSLGTMDDPPGLTIRESARVAASLNNARQGGHRITVCPRCGLTSFNAGDIANRYCGRCHRFYGDPVDAEDDDG